MAPKQKKGKENTDPNLSNPPSFSGPETSKKIPIPVTHVVSNSPTNIKAVPKAPKPWTEFTPAEKSAWATQSFITTGSWKYWEKGLQKEFLTSVEPGGSTEGSRQNEELSSDSNLERDRNGRRIAEYTAEEFEKYKERKRELNRLRGESWEFREREFIARKLKQRERRRVAIAGEDVRGELREEKELDSPDVSEAEIEEERERRKRMVILEERGGSVGRYSGDPEWDDVVPLVQEESEGALASIAYTDEYAEAMSYLRAAMLSSEHTPRILTLTSHIISLNPAHYTVWLYRAQTLFALNSPLATELEWLNSVALANQKNYQIWHHRQLLITHLYPKDPTTNTFETRDGDADASAEWLKKKDDLITKETDFMTLMLDSDSKNYHVWSYRHWLTTYLNLFSLPTELTYTNTLITQDLRNNSAYSHRYFLVFNNPAFCTEGLKPTERDEKLMVEGGEGWGVVRREIKWIEGWILEAPGNGGAWGYLRGVLRRGGVALSELSSFAGNFVDLGDDESRESDAGKQENIKSSQALEFMADIWSGGDGDVVGNGDGVTEGDGKKDLRKADKAFMLLGEKYDPIRRNYWEWRREGLKIV